MEYVPEDVVGVVMEKVVERAKGGELLNVRCVSKGVAEMAEKRMENLLRRLRNEEEVDFHFPGLTTHARKSILRTQFLRGNAEMPPSFQVGEAKRRRCCFCKGRYAGGLSAFWTKRGECLLLHAHEACIRERTAPTFLLNGK